jgi:ferritin-like protein
MSDERHSRAQVLRAAAAAGAAVGAGALVRDWARPDASAAAPSQEKDVRILGFLLVLEQAQAAFYDAALRSKALSGDLLRYAQVVAPQEHDHVELLRRRLGAGARPAPRFDFGEATSSPAQFRRAAIDLEEAAAAAYIGQGASLTRSGVALAAGIVAVEARHAAWIRDLAGAEPAPHAADPGRSPSEILTELRTKGFLP